MSQENIEVVQRFESLMVPSLEETDHDAAHRRQEEILAILDPEVVFFATPSLPHGGTYVGHDAFFKMGEQFRDLWDIADGLLAGAVQYWLYSRQPCGDPRCQDCLPISTAEARVEELKRLIRELAADSEYYHTPTDSNAGRA